MRSYDNRHSTGPDSFGDPDNEEGAAGQVGVSFGGWDQGEGGVGQEGTARCKVTTQRPFRAANKESENVSQLLILERHKRL